MSITTIIVLSIIAGGFLLAFINYKFQKSFPDLEDNEGEL